MLDVSQRFAVAATDVQLAWRSVRRGIDLERICSFRYLATVLNDHTVRLGGLVIDVAPGPRTRSYARARVEVSQRLDGSWRVYLGTTVIATAARIGTGELRALTRRRRRPPSAAAVGEPPVALRAPSGSPTAQLRRAVKRTTTGRT